MDKERLQKLIEEQSKRICIGFPCPNCGEDGGIYAVKNKKNGKLWAYCDECDTLWKSLEDIKSENWVEDWGKEFVWGGYATIEEVEEFGWNKYK